MTTLWNSDKSEIVLLSIIATNGPLGTLIRLELIDMPILFPELIVKFQKLLHPDFLTFCAVKHIVFSGSDESWEVIFQEIIVIETIIVQHLVLEGIFSSLRAEFKHGILGALINMKGLKEFLLLI